MNKLDVVKEQQDSQFGQSGIHEEKVTRDEVREIGMGIPNRTLWVLVKVCILF